MACPRNRPFGAYVRCEAMADWIFEGNPRHYDLEAAVASSRDQWWGTPHFRDQMAVGDRVWLQVVGPKDPGIYYIATITSPTYEHSVEPSDPADGRDARFRWRTDIRFDYRVRPPLLRSELAEDAQLGSFRPFRGFEGSNVPVPPEIASALAARVASRLESLGLRPSPRSGLIRAEQPQHRDLPGLVVGQQQRHRAPGAVDGDQRADAAGHGAAGDRRHPGRCARPAHCAAPQRRELICIGHRLAFGPPAGVDVAEAAVEQRLRRLSGAGLPLRSGRAPGRPRPRPADVPAGESGQHRAGRPRACPVSLVPPPAGPTPEHVIPSGVSSRSASRSW